MWLSRLNKILSNDEINEIRNKTVLIIGIGGVGGYSLESLVRMGINNLIIVDNDVVDIANLNRQIISLNSNIGEKKVEVAKKRILDINKDCNVITIDKFITKENILDLFKYHIDYVIDACDTVSTKIEIIRECLNRNIKIISSMGTGNKFHPEMLKITELKKTSYDPLAKVIRNKFKEEKRKIMVVSSTEKGIDINDRTPGSTSLVPSVAGILCASYVINDILEGLWQS
ncbi:MAG: ThiF family adenylyltransferase [Bacilli bacterium]|nr:ThiF family adenylyltransferase [Bacilli bacterium]